MDNRRRQPARPTPPRPPAPPARPTRRALPAPAPALPRHYPRTVSEREDPGGPERAEERTSLAPPLAVHLPPAPAHRHSPRRPAAPPAPAWPTVLACGLATLDVVQTVDHVPAPDEKLVATGLDVSSGGPAANAAVTCALLGVPARLLTRVGGGALGELVARDLADAGVDLVDLAPDGARPPVSTVLVTRATGERAVVSVNATLAPASGPADPTVPDGVWSDVAVVLVDGHHLDLAVVVAAQARRRGVPVVLDGGSWKPGLEALLAHVDVAVLSADFRVPDGVPRPGRPVPDGAPRPGAPVAPAPDAADVLAAVLRLGPTVVARSAGPGPIEVATADGARARVPVPAVTVVDTLGAGDVLHGALAARLAARSPAPSAAPRTTPPAPPSTTPPPTPPATPPAFPADDVVPALTWAAVVASASCASPGARGWARDAALVARLRAELAG